MFRSKPILIIMTRWPAPGRCKRRLAKGIGLKKAAYIQQKMTEHTIAVCSLLAKDSLVDIHLAVSGASLSSAKKWGKGQGIKHVTTQGEGSLGLRMRRQVIKSQKLFPAPLRGEKSVILIGTDLPDLSKRDLLDAIEMLESKDLAIGPSKDGGYWLIGLSNRLATPAAAWPFSGIPWGTKEVLGKTLREARMRKIEAGILNIRNDLDTTEDLKEWQA